MKAFALLALQNLMAAAVLAELIGEIVIVPVNGVTGIAVEKAHVILDKLKAKHAAMEAHKQELALHLVDGVLGKHASTKEFARLDKLNPAAHAERKHAKAIANGAHAQGKVFVSQDKQTAQDAEHAKQELA